MKLAALSIGIAAAVVLIGLAGMQAPSAKADGGPHVMNQPMTTDACAGCHRAHTAQGAYLLKVTELQLCTTCHDGSAANTNVLDGVQLSVQGPRDPVPDGDNAAQTVNGALRGGGFEFARINAEDPTDNFDPHIGVGGPEPVTSRHSIDGSPQVAWGNGAINSGAGLSGFALECSSCHNPHGNGQYRLLRPIPTGSGAATGVNVPEVAQPHVYATADYFNASFGNATGNSSNWCAQCHTRYRAIYVAGSATEVTDSGDAIFAYRHRTEGDAFTGGCVRCHAPHGTNATMSGFAATVARPGQGTGGVGGPDAGSSSLLKMDNRGICQKCHTR